MLQQPARCCSRRGHTIHSVKSETMGTPGSLSSWMRDVTASELLTPVHERCCDEKGVSMSRGRWLLLGAIALGFAVGIYFLFFCPTECH